MTSALNMTREDNIYCITSIQSGTRNDSQEWRH